MPKLKNKCNKVASRRIPHRLEEGTAEEIAAAMLEIIQESKSHQESADKIRKLIADLIRRCGTHRTQNMNQKNKDDAMQVFTHAHPALQKIQEKIGEAIEILKEIRTKKIVEGKDAGGLDPLHIIELRHGCLPVWYSWVSEKPYGVAGIQWSDSMKIVAGTEVAAFVETEKVWILAEVKSVVGNHRYECVDIDDQEQKKTAVYARKQIIPMPKYTVDYRDFPHFALPKNAIVLALFPKTTCFYEGIVHEPPKMMSEWYQIRFVDTQMPGNYAAPVAVSDRYVVAYKKESLKKAHVRPSKKGDAGAAPPSNEPSTSTVTVELSKSQKKRNKRKQKKQEELAAMNDKDVPGPAPPPVAMEDADDDVVEAPKARSQSKPRTKSAEPKVKIIRGKIPAHKKAGYNRLFGKRRRKPKKADASISAQKETSSSAQAQEETQDPEEMDHDANQGDEDGVGQVLTGLAMYGLEDEREETESEESSDDSSGEEEKSDDNKEGEKSDEEEEEELEDDEPNHDEGEVITLGESPAREDVDDEEEEEDEEEGGEDEQPEPHDPEEGTSSRPNRSSYQSESDNEKRGGRSSSSGSSSSSSSVESGLSLSDHERNRRVIDSDHEPEL